MIGIDRQIEAMKTLWPMFRVSRVSRPANSARWNGKLAPQFSSYEIEILSEHGYPSVRILSPKLIVQPDNEEGLLPHIYGGPEDFRLCLFDPETDEWSSDKLIAETIVPFTIDWLCCYEFWTLTGEWRGGGRHLCAN